MPLILVADKDSELPEALRPLAKQEGGKFIVARDSWPDGWDLQDVKGLTSTLGKLKQEGREKDAKLLAYAGIEDPAKALKAMEDVDNGRVRTKDEVAALVKQHEDKLAKAEAALALKGDELREEIKGNRVREAMGDAGMKSKYAETVKSRARWTKNGDGKEHLTFVDDAGKLAINSQGDPMTATEFVASMQKGWPEAFEVQGPGGAGSRGTNGDAGVRGTNKKMDPNASPAALFAQHYQTG